MDVVDVLINWGRDHLALILLVGAVAVILLRLARTLKLDRAEKVFRRVGLRVPLSRINQLRDEYAKTALDSERRRLAEDTKQQAELEAMQREKARILNMVRNTPQVVKEVGETLQAIEREYERSVRQVKSEQAREGLRLATQKQIQEVLRSVASDAAKLPPFEIQLEASQAHRDLPSDAPQERTRLNDAATESA